MSETNAAPISARKNGKTMHLQLGEKTEGWEVLSSGIVLYKMERDEWLGLAKRAIGDFEFSRDNHLAAMFRLGDILNYGERVFGEEYAQAIDSTRKVIRLSMKTLENVAWICGSIAADVRHPMLTLSHHEVVAKLSDTAEQKMFLDLAEEEELSVSELRKKVKEAHPGTRRSTVKNTVDLGTEEGLFTASEALANWLEQDETDPAGEWAKDRGSKWFPTITRIFAFFAGAEEVAREGSKAIASYLDNPDNGPLKEWKEKRRGKWADALNAISKAARRMGVSACGNPKGAKPAAGEAEPEPAPET